MRRAKDRSGGPGAPGGRDGIFHFLPVFLLLLLLSLPREAAAQTVLLALPLDGPTPVTAEEIALSPQGVRIQVQGRALKDVLQRIQNVSGIRFELATTLMAVPMTTTLDAPDWPTALQELLRPFGRAEVRDADKQLRHVLVVNRGGRPELPPITAPELRILKGELPPAAREAGTPEQPAPPPDDPGTAEAPPGVTLSEAPDAGPPVGEALPPDAGPPADSPAGTGPNR